MFFSTCSLVHFDSIARTVAFLSKETYQCHDQALFRWCTCYIVNLPFFVCIEVPFTGTKSKRQCVNGENVRNGQFVYAFLEKLYRVLLVIKTPLFPLAKIPLSLKNKTCSSGDNAYPICAFALFSKYTFVPSIANRYAVLSCFAKWLSKFRSYCH